MAKWPLITNYVPPVLGQPDADVSFLAELESYYAGCDRFSFPWRGTLVQTSLAKRVFDSGDLPVSLVGVQSWLYYNERGAEGRPPAVQEAMTANFIGPEAQSEQRLTGGGVDVSQVMDLAEYWQHIWAIQAIEAGKLACYVARNFGGSTTTAIAFHRTRAGEWASKLPAGVITTADSQPYGVIFVPGTGPTTTYYDPGVTPPPGGWPEGPPSFIGREGDGYWWSDGSFRDPSGNIIIPPTGTTAPVVTQPVADPLPNSEAPYIQPPTTDGTRSGSGGTPVLASATAPATDPFESDDLTIGRGPGSTGITPPYVIPTTGGGSGGGSTGNPAPQPTTTLPTGAVTTTTTTGGTSFNLSALVLGLPLWAWLAAGAVIITKRKG